MSRKNAYKVGAMISAENKKKLQAIHNHTVDMGASCTPMADEEAEEEAEKSLTAAKLMTMGTMGGADYARQEGWDISGAAYALANIAGLVNNEADEPDDMSSLAKIMRGLLEFISGEIDEMEAAAHGQTYKAISKREDVNPKRGETEYGDVKFADEKNKKYPLDDKDHIEAAWNYIHQERNAAKYDPDEVELIKKHIVAAWKEKIDKEGPPSAEKKNVFVNFNRFEEQRKDFAALNLSYVKSLGLSIPADKFAVKSIGSDTIRHYAFLWGNPDRRDIEGEYFTHDSRDPSKSTDLWDDRLGTAPKPLTWDHNMDVSFKADPVVGQSVEWGDDEIGRWVVSKLDRAHRYRKAIDELIERGALGSSSDSVLQYVQRQKVGKAIWIKSWPWFATSLTDCPAEPRMVDSVEMVKSFGVKLPDVPDGKAWKFADKRRQLIEILSKPS